MKNSTSATLIRRGELTVLRLHHASVDRLPNTKLVMACGCRLLDLFCGLKHCGRLSWERLHHIVRSAIALQGLVTLDGMPK